MADYFLDTSALVKRHVTEAGSIWIRSLVRAKAAHTLYIARITAVEVYSAITRRQHIGDLSAAQAARSSATSAATWDNATALLSFPSAISPRLCLWPASTAFGRTTPCSLL